MVARFRSWWHYIKRHRVAIGVIAIVLVVVITLNIVGYWFDWTGFNGYNKVTIIHTISGTNAGTVTKTEEYQPGKTLWDWLQLLIIPLALAIIAIFFNRAERKNEQRIASDNQQEAALQGYINEMSELLLERDLRKSDVDAEVRIIARVRTLTVLPRLDKARKRNVLKFLHESNLINKGKSIVDLDGADLSEADLNGVSLRGAYLSGVNLSKANLFEAYLSEVELGGAHLRDAILSYANLSKADLSGANLMNAHLNRTSLEGTILSYTNLSKADLSRTDLREADLSYANLIGANVSPEQWNKAKSLKGATMPDGSIHP